MTIARILAALAAAALATASSAAAAQDWPQRPVRIIVPFGPGGTSDTLGRIVAQDLSIRFGQQFVVENRPGAGGVIGSAEVAKERPEGYALVVSGIGSHVVAPAINPNVSFDPIADFTHIAMLGGPPAVLVAHPALGVRTVAELTALLKQAGQIVSYASPGAGTHGHLIGEYFKEKTGVEMEHIPYRGAGTSIADLIAGHVQVGSFTLSSAAAQIRAGALIPLAVASAERLPQFPEVQTFVEAGLPGLVSTTWFALSGPKAMPAEIVDPLNAAVVEIMRSPEVTKRLQADAIQVEPLKPAEVTAFFQSEIARWTPIARTSGAQAE